MKRVISLSLIAFVIGVAAMARQFAIGKEALSNANSAESKGDRALLIGYLRSAAQARTPFSPYPELGFERLAKIAHDAELRGDETEALAAYSAMRSAALQTRALFGASRWFGFANEGIVRVGSSHANADQKPERAMLVAATAEPWGPDPLSFAAIALGAAALFGIGAYRGRWRAHQS